jgi:hypothetical protein
MSLPIEISGHHHPKQLLHAAPAQSLAAALRFKKMPNKRDPLCNTHEIPDSIRWTGKVLGV